jgi:hypothetical protein
MPLRDAVSGAEGRSSSSLRIRAGSGLGDSCYVRPIAEHFLRQGKRVTVMSHFPDVFIGSGAAVEPFNRNNIDVLAHYTLARQTQTTTQYQDMLNCAGIRVPVPLSFKWEVRNWDLIDSLKAKARGRKIVIVHGGRTPFGRMDGHGFEILPEQAAFETAIRAMEGCFFVRIGKGPQLYPLPVDLDLNDKTRVSDLLDMVLECDGILSMCGFPVPMAECFDKPLLAIWSSRGLASSQPIVASITPGKILSKPTSRYVVDDWLAAKIHEAADAFRAVL